MDMERVRHKTMDDQIIDGWHDVRRMQKRLPESTHMQRTFNTTPASRGLRRTRR